MGTKGAVAGKWMLVALAALGAPACVAAAAAGAGAATGIYLTSRGAESLVQAPADEVAARAQRVMQAMDITPTETVTKQTEGTREFQGKSANGELDVTITVSPQDANTSKVEVTARRNLVEWDKDYAKTVLQRIAEPG